MNLWKTDGAFLKPNGIRKYSYEPPKADAAVYFTELGLTGI